MFPHLYYSLIVGDTTSAHLVENKTYNHDNNSSPGNVAFCWAYQIGERPIIQTRSRNGEPPRTALHTSSLGKKKKKKKRLGPLQILIKGHLTRPPPISSAVDMTISCEVIKSGTDI